MDILAGFCWHSAIGIDAAIEDNKKFFTRLPNTKRARSMFMVAGDGTLIHKTTRALWKLSDDKQCIVPVFDNTVLSEDDVRQAMEEDQ